MTRGQATQIGERVAVLETKIDAVEAHNRAILSKLDAIIEGQAAGAKDRADLRDHLTDLSQTVQKMQPEVQVVRDARTIVRVGAWVAASVAAVVSAVWAAWAWALKYVTLK